ncbi:MAG: hypothetical protein H0X17_13270 [Deltaproteobacteria bacterium]|nr:hypothetical protein [Deltaproteobacteria bacterium]
MARLGVYHLVRKANGPAPFQAFVRSLRAAPPRGDWGLVLIFKGFDGEPDARPYLEVAAGLPVTPVFVSDRGVDITAYFAAAARTHFETLVFFNSYCELLDPRWCAIYEAALAQPEVGLVGATGSLESVVRNHVVYGQTSRGVVAKAQKYALAGGLLALFPPFPNAHVRTNAFMIHREQFLATKRFPVGNRLAALVYESGWLSLTRQIQAMGLRVLVVNRDGHGLPPDEWADAGTFRSGTVDKLLVSDNRTREYLEAPEPRQRLLRSLAYGDQR